MSQFSRFNQNDYQRQQAMSSNNNRRINNNNELVAVILAQLGNQNPEARKQGMGIKQQVLINILLQYINDPAVTATIFQVGLYGLSPDLLQKIQK